MSYVDENLMPGERVVYSAKIHWFVFVPPALLLLFSMWLMGQGQEEGTGPVFGTLIFLFAIYGVIRAVIIKKSTELAVTSKRVIAKTGLIRRHTVELNHSKVESFNIHQGIFGRILGFGTLIVNGTGGGKTPIPSIEHPMQFRKNAMETIDASQSKVS